MDIMKSFQTLYTKLDISLKNMFLWQLKLQKILRIPIGLKDAISGSSACPSQNHLCPVHFLQDTLPKKIMMLLFKNLELSLPTKWGPLGARGGPSLSLIFCNCFSFCPSVISCYRTAFLPQIMSPPHPQEIHGSTHLTVHNLLHPTTSFQG